MPPTVVYLGSGTIESPWPPSTIAWMSAPDTPSSIARNARKRAESRMPAMPSTRCFGNPVVFQNSHAITSSGFVTTTT